MSTSANEKAGVSISPYSQGAQLVRKAHTEAHRLDTTRIPGRVIFFPTLVPGSGNFQLSRLAGLGYWLGFWVVITIIVSLTLTLTLITTLTVILL